MMRSVKVRIKVGMIGSTVTWNIGDIVNLPRKAAGDLVAIGRAEFVNGKPDAASEAAAVEPDEATVRPRPRFRKKMS